MKMLFFIDTQEVTMEKERKADKYYDTFPTKLRNLLKARNITHTSLASHLNISRQSISQYCDGSTQPNIETIIKIAEFFNVSTDFLFGLSDVESTDPATQSLCESLGLSEIAVNYLRQDSNISKVINFLVNQHSISCQSWADWEQDASGDDVIFSILDLLNDFLSICDSRNDVRVSLSSRHNIFMEIIFNGAFKEVEYLNQGESSWHEIGNISIAEYSAKTKLDEITDILMNHFNSKFHENIRLQRSELIMDYLKKREKQSEST